jgi:dUTP pyrophosphatase
MNTLLIKANEGASDLYVNHDVAYDGDSGIDLFFTRDFIVKGNSNLLIDLEISCNLKKGDIDSPYYIYPRSSISKSPLRMANSVGIIDSQYRHTLKVSVDNITSSDYIIKRGDKLFQICAPDLGPIKLQHVDDLSSTSRGAGFGSSDIISKK